MKRYGNMTVNRLVEHLDEMHKAPIEREDFDTCKTLATIMLYIDECYFIEIKGKD